MPDTPENRWLWLSDFKEKELRDILRTLLDVAFVEMIVKGDERGFRLTNRGRVTIEAFSKQSSRH